MADSTPSQDTKLARLRAQFAKQTPDFRRGYLAATRQVANDLLDDHQAIGDPTAESRMVSEYTVTLSRELHDRANELDE